mmetsp:Transcript_25881/g.40517  ORF Transcript_25881/g.40517 Transcript_25881/m.40517 type:complete len:294 (-) Transcript_25881:234-1115(-)
MTLGEKKERSLSFEQSLDIHRCTCCHQKRGWWTLCHGELFHRFRSSVEWGVADLQRTRSLCGLNSPTKTLSDLHPMVYAAEKQLTEARPLLLGVLGSACSFWALQTKVSGLLQGFRGSSPGVLKAPLLIAGCLSTLALISSIGLHKVMRQIQILRDQLESNPAKGRTCEVTRAGALQVISAENLVPGDVLHLKAGSVVPADCRIIESQSLVIDHSFLPSFFHPVRGGFTLRADPDQEDSALLSSRCAALTAGTVVSGSGTGLVTRTGEGVVGVVLLRQLCKLSWSDCLALAVG